MQMVDEILDCKHMSWLMLDVLLSPEYIYVNCLTGHWVLYGAAKIIIYWTVLSNLVLYD